MKLFFGLCAGFLYLVSVLTGHSYREVAVWINVYFQAFLLLFSALYLAFYSFRFLWKKHKKILLLLLPWIAVQAAGFLVFAKRYFFKPWESVFQDTMVGLQDLAKLLHTDYFTINIVLYVFIYGAVVMANFAIVRLIRNLAR